MCVYIYIYIYIHTHSYYASYPCREEQYPMSDATWQAIGNDGKDAARGISRARYTYSIYNVCVYIYIYIMGSLLSFRQLSFQKTLELQKGCRVDAARSISHARYIYSIHMGIWL